MGECESTSVRKANTHTSEAAAQAKQQQTHTHKMPGAKGKKRGAKAAPAARQLSTKNEDDKYQHWKGGEELGSWMVSVRYYGPGNDNDLEVKMREIRAKVQSGDARTS